MSLASQAPTRYATNHRTLALNVWLALRAIDIDPLPQGCLNTHPTENNVIIYPVGKVRECPWFLFGV